MHNKPQISMKDTGFVHGSREYKTEYQRRRRAFLNGNPQQTKRKPTKPQPKTRQVSRVNLNCCICSEKMERSATGIILNGEVFTNTKKNGRIIKAFACNDCI